MRAGRAGLAWGASATCAGAGPCLGWRPGVATAASLDATGDPTPSSCTGDCDTDGQVTIDEFLIMVNIALGNASVSTCLAGDATHDGKITIGEIITAVHNTLTECVQGARRGVRRRTRHDVNATTAAP